MQTINAQLVQGSQVAFKPQGATLSTYFDLERGRLDPHWDLYEDNAGYVRAGLTLWTRPYGHTGTTRLVASMSAAPVWQFGVTGIAGDIRALANLRATSVTNATSYALIWGVHNSASYQGVSSAAPLATAMKAAGGGLSPTLVGAFAGVASQYAAINVVPTGQQTILQMDLGGLDVWGGHRYRLLAIARNHVGGGASPGGGFYASITQGYTSGTTRAITATNFRLYDLGEMSIPSSVPSFVATVTLTLAYAGASGATALATYPVQLTSLVALPIDINAGMWISGSAAYNTRTYRVRGIERTVTVEADASRLANPHPDMVMLGDFPMIPALGSSTPSGPAQVVGFVGAMGVGPGGISAPGFIGSPDAFLGFEVRERFTYLR